MKNLILLALLLIFQSHYIAATELSGTLPRLTVESTLGKANTNDLPDHFIMDYNRTGGTTYSIEWHRVADPQEISTITVIDASRRIILPRSKFIRYEGRVLRSDRSLAIMHLFDEHTEISLSSKETGNVFISKKLNHQVQYAAETNFSVLEEHITPCAPSLTNNDTRSMSLRGSQHTCKKIYLSITADHDLYLLKNQDITAVTNYLTSVLANVQAIYRLEEIQLGIAEIIIHKSPDPLRHLSALDDLNIFRFIRPSYNGDIALCLSGYKDGSGRPPLGGHAFLNALCNRSLSYAYANIDGSFTSFPNYSWDIFSVAHELGHVIGSPHTHACAWGPSQNETLDNCSPPEGSCAPGPPPLNGTIMSYCHLPGQPGVNFAAGFGKEPGDLLRSKIALASCLNDYIPQQTQDAVSATIKANMECYDGQYTHYYFDNNTSQETDDILIASIDKGGQNIGHVYDGTLIISSTYTSDVRKSHAAPITAPYVPSGRQYYVMHKFWEIKPLRQPSTPVTIKVPYIQSDQNQLDASVVQQLTVQDIKAFTIKSPGIPDPTTNHRYTTTTLYKEYNYGTWATTSQWKSSTAGPTRFAEFKTRELYGIGLGAYSSLVLPVHLVHFSGSRSSNKMITLDWSTASESGLAHFGVERSIDGIDYQTVAIVPSKGSNSLYSLKDLPPLPDQGYYYRLRQQDANGDYTYSRVIFVNDLSGERKIRLRSNSAHNNQIEILSDKAISDANIHIFMSDGRQVKVPTTVSFDIITLDMTGLIPGCYFLSACVNGQWLNTPILINR